MWNTRFHKETECADSNYSRSSDPHPPITAAWSSLDSHMLAKTDTGVNCPNSVEQNAAPSRPAELSWCKLVVLCHCSDALGAVTPRWARSDALGKNRWIMIANAVQDTYLFYFLQKISEKLFPLLQKKKSKVDLSWNMYWYMIPKKAKNHISHLKSTPNCPQCLNVNQGV